MSHTASLTSSVEVFQALCRQVNTIQVGDIHEMIDVLVALSRAMPYPAGRGIVVLGVGGGPSVEAGDHMEKAGLQLTALSAQAQAELKGFLPNAGVFSPIPWMPPTLYSPMLFIRP